MLPNISLATIIKEVCLSMKDYIVDIYGWSGTVAVTLAYALTSFDVDQDIFIDILNIYGSISIGYVTYAAKVWQALACEVIWFGIGSYSLINNLLGEEV